MKGVKNVSSNCFCPTCGEHFRHRINYLKHVRKCWVWNTKTKEVMDQLKDSFYSGAKHNDC